MRVLSALVRAWREADHPRVLERCTHAIEADRLRLEMARLTRERDEAREAVGAATWRAECAEAAEKANRRVLGGGGLA